MDHCGNISEKFSISRGARQGDPIASYLFIISIEILAHKLRSDPQVHGFKLDENLSHLLELYADDCSIFLEPSAENLEKTVEILNDFFKLSGLKISISKTKAIWFGNNCKNLGKLCPNLNLDWVNNFRLLGVDFDNDLDNMKVNFDNKIQEIKKLLNVWIYRTMSVYGKIVVIKTLGLSKLSHLAIVLPSLNKKDLKSLESLFFDFIWGKKVPKVSKEHVKLPEKKGGLGLPDVEKFWKSLKFSWLRRLSSTEAFWPKILLKTMEEKADFSGKYQTSLN